ncbi:MAG: glycosyltransferase family 39 protein [Deltaproteobacteria bacterium]|nr:glycosyltransferase family 39 protein [Deltaproteobacteria bacterium]
MSSSWSQLPPRLLAIATGVFALALVVLLRGRTHPDEIFQYLEPAFRSVYGYGEVAWEWRDGIRNWFAPGLIALLLRGLHALHVESPRIAMDLLWLLGAIWHGWGMLGLYRIVERRDGKGPAALAVLLVGTWGAYVLYAPRTLSDALAMPPLLWAIFFTLRARDDGDFKSGLLVGLLAGLAVVLRYPSLVFVAPLGVGLLLARRWRSIGGMALGGSLMVVALGVLDQLTWGAFLHSLRAYLAFNRPGGPVAQAFGSEPWWWYVLPLGGMMPLVLLPWFVRGLKRFDVLAGAWFFYLATLEVSAHKEARFVLPLIPLGVAIAIGPFFATLEGWCANRPRRTVGLALAWAAMSILSPALQWTVQLDRDLLDAEDLVGGDRELASVLVWQGGNYSDGGRFHLRRDVPLDQDGPGPRLGEKLAAGHYSHVMLKPEASALEALSSAGYALWLTQGSVQVWKRGAHAR